MAASIVTGILLFVFPLTLSIVPLEYTGIQICSVATFAAVQEGHFIRTGKDYLIYGTRSEKRRSRCIT